MVGGRCFVTTPLQLSDERMWVEGSSKEVVWVDGSRGLMVDLMVAGCGLVVDLMVVGCGLVLAGGENRGGCSFIE